MKQTDMELQAIREKLQLLNAEPPMGETLALPWSAPREQLSIPLPSPVASPMAASAASQTTQPAPTQGEQAIEQSPQAIAIEMLKQRSRNSETAANSRTEHLIAQELYRLEVQANNINERSQQQAADIMSLKRSAQQAAIGLRRQGIHDHPQLAIITQFLAQYPSAAVPQIERDDQGYFALSYETVDFHQAEQDAIATAQTLRNRHQGSQPPTAAMPFSQPIEESTLKTGSPRRTTLQSHHAANEEQPSELANSWLKTTIGNTINGLEQRLGKRQHRRPKFNPDIEEGFDIETDTLQNENWSEGMANSNPLAPPLGEYSGSQFTWLDGTIWFSGAAIARILLQGIITHYPIVTTALMLGLVGAILFALYRIVVVRSTDYTLVYRLCIGMMGLFLAGLF